MILQAQGEFSEVALEGVEVHFRDRKRARVDRELTVEQCAERLVKDAVRLAVTYCTRLGPGAELERELEAARAACDAAYERWEAMLEEVAS